MTCSPGAVWGSMSHSRTLHHAVRRQQAINPDGWQPSSTFWATIIYTQAADWFWRHTVWLLNELRKNVTLYWKTIFFHAFFFSRHCGCSLTAEKHSSWHKQTHGALLPGWTVCSQRCCVKVFYFQSSVTANQLTLASPMLCINTSRPCRGRHTQELFMFNPDWPFKIKYLCTAPLRILL